MRRKYLGGTFIRCLATWTLGNGSLRLLPLAVERLSLRSGRFSIQKLMDSFFSYRYSSSAASAGFSPSSSFFHWRLHPTVNLQTAVPLGVEESSLSCTQQDKARISKVGLSARGVHALFPGSIFSGLQGNPRVRYDPRKQGCGKAHCRPSGQRRDCCTSLPCTSIATIRIAHVGGRLVGAGGRYGIAALARVRGDHRHHGLPMP